jgi:hypothetical protein
MGADEGNQETRDHDMQTEEPGAVVGGADGAVLVVDRRSDWDQGLGPGAARPHRPVHGDRTQAGEQTAGIEGAVEDNADGARDGAAGASGWDAGGDVDKATLVDSMAAGRVAGRRLTGFGDKTAGQTCTGCIDTAAVVPGRARGRARGQAPGRICSSFAP